MVSQSNKISSGASALILSLVCLLAGCIKNDLPYPKIPQAIRSIACQGEESPAIIDSIASTVTLRLLETTDIYNLRFTDFTYTPEATPSPNLLEGTYDLSEPIVVTLSLYQDYQWIIKAEQTIERRFHIEGQIGETVIDNIGRRVIVKVPEASNLSALKLTDIKLGPEGITTLSPALEPGTINLSRPLPVKVTFHNHTEDWTIFAERTTQIVTTTSVDPWSCVAWVYGSAPADAVNTFEYRRESDTQWTRVPEAEVTKNSGSFSYCIPHLDPMARYVVRAISDENIGNELTFETDPTDVLPDASFDLWYKEGAVWYPFPEEGPAYWDTGNKGAATLGESNVTPSDDVPPGLTGKSAKLETKFVGVFGIGKLAAGSIYTGSFQRVDGTNGILDFGRQWTLRPTRLRGYYNYTNGPIDYSSKEMKQLVGRPDSCHIYIALTDWTAPYQIRTNPSNRQLFNPRSPEVIAYGELISGDPTGGWREFEIKLDYRWTNRKPSYILITCAGSKYGDYFTGSTSSILYVDDFSLLFDY